MKNVSLPIQLVADLLLAFATWSLLQLALKQFQQGDACPLLLGVPACYLLLIAVGIAWLGRIVSKLSILYWIGIAIPWGVALLASIGQVAGKIECPKSEAGIPMCFMSLGLFSVLIGLALLAKHLRKKSV